MFTLFFLKLLQKHFDSWWLVYFILLRYCVVVGAAVEFWFFYPSNAVAQADWQMYTIKLAECYHNRFFIPAWKQANKADCQVLPKDFLALSLIFQVLIVCDTRIQACVYHHLKDSFKKCDQFLTWIVNPVFLSSIHTSKICETSLLAQMCICLLCEFSFLLIFELQTPQRRPYYQFPYIPCLL